MTKKVLSSLLAVAFLESQALALSGGPPSVGAGTIVTSGTYAGVLVVQKESNPSTSSSGTADAAAIGIFSIGVPTTGIATGDAVVFVDGTAYNGNIIGVANPNDNTLSAIVEGTSDFTLQNTVQTGVDAAGNPVFTVETSNIFAQGNLLATISQAFNPSGEELLVTTGVIISGTADLELFSEVNADGTPDVTNTVRFLVDGTQQSNTTTTSATFTFGLGTGTGG